MTRVEPVTAAVAVGGWRRGIAALDRWQQRWRPTAFAVAVVRKFADDRAGRAAALVAYYGFFSLFPLLLVAVTIVGFVFSGGQRDWVLHTALAQLPGLREAMTDDVKPLTGSVTALVLGLATALWAGLGCMLAAQDGINAVWGVPRRSQPNFFYKRVRAASALAAVAFTLVVGAAVTQVTTVLPAVPGLGRVAGFVASAALNACLFAVAFQVLAAGRQRWRDVLIGGAVAGVGYTGLHIVGQWFVVRRVEGASAAYGTFAVVIGLLTWLYLLAQLSLLAAEIVVVRADRLYPRSLTGPPRTPADLVVAARIAAVYRLDEPA